jgi:spermidine/putrescine transport system substrate-binding protein
MVRLINEPLLTKMLRRDQLWVGKSTDKPVKSKKGITRRDFIKTTVAAGVAASVGPWFVKDALSTSGELILFTWSDYSKPEVIGAFEKATGIKVKITNYGSNPECMTKLRAARASGFDIAQPSLDSVAAHMEFDLYREIDESKIPNLKNMEPVFYEVKETRRCG